MANAVTVDDAATKASHVASKCYANEGNPAVVDAVPQSATTVLDVGCGAGDNARLLHSRGKVVDGITLSQPESTEAERWCRRVIIADLEGGLPTPVANDTYDACICSHVLEHLRWPEELLGQIRLRLSPQHAGVTQLVIALPNIMFYKTRWNLIMGRFDYASGGIMDASHFRWFTFDTGRRLIEQSGFRVLRAIGTGGVPLSIFRRVLPSSVQSAIDKTAVALRPGLFAGQMIFEACVA
ncbi:MAG: class I SAM-dependent methyltransferase [Planctomycetaceae bacterium]|nr:class I SAM-dependent methyltransferase [Planctomycetaceae bacterium]